MRLSLLGPLVLHAPRLTPVGAPGDHLLVPDAYVPDSPDDPNRDEQDDRYSDSGDDVSKHGLSLPHGLFRQTLLVTGRVRL